MATCRLVAAFTNVYPLRIMNYWKGWFSATNLKLETFGNILTECSSCCQGEKVSNFKLVSDDLTAEAMCGTNCEVLTCSLFGRYYH